MPPSEREKEWGEAFLHVLRMTRGCIVHAAQASEVPRQTIYDNIYRDRSFRRQVERITGRTFRAGMLAVLLLAAGLSPLRATITSSPVDLGTAGLTVTVGLRHWQSSAPDSWPTATCSGCTVNDLGAGLYTVSGLPLATGTDRYAVTLTAGGVSLFTYSYGAQPGVQLVWKEELELPSAPTRFVVGDSYGSLQLVVTRRLPSAACDVGTTATATAASEGSNVALFTDQTATISNCQQDQTTGTYGATFTYDLTAGDLDTVGRYVAQFKICYAPDSCQTLPSDLRLRFEVVKRAGG